jgi:hypothetical protein
VFRNCTTYSSLQTRQPLEMAPWFPKPSGSVYVGFVGSFHESRVDVALVEHVVRSCPEYHFLIVGWVSEALEPLVARNDNLHYVGEMPNESLGTVLRSFDAAIIPHADNEATRGNDLLKLLDLNACQVPVVSTNVSGVDSGKYIVKIASTPRDFVASLRQCVQGQHGLDLLRGRENARQQSWEVQVLLLAQTIELPVRQRSALIASTVR